MIRPRPARIDSDPFPCPLGLDGWAAMNLEMPARVPRTEYSAHEHWPLVSQVLGRAIDQHSPAVERQRASQDFVQAWGYDFWWSVCIGSTVDLAEKRTRLGHAEYAAGGSDRDDEVGCPWRDVAEVLAFDPWAIYGRRDRATLVRRFEEQYLGNCAAHPGCVNMSGIYITLVSGLIDVFGWDLLLAAAGEDPKGFGEVTTRYADWIMQYFEALAEARIPAVMVHDDMVWTSGPFIRPAWYREFIFPAYHRLFRPLIESGKKVTFTSDGNWTPFIDDVVATGVHGVVMEPCTDMARFAERHGRTHYFIGNADTRILLAGDQAQIRAEVERCMAIGKSCPGFFLAVGNHIPANTPVANALCYDAAYRALAQR